MTSKSTFKRVTVQKTGKMPEPTQGESVEQTPLQKKLAEMQAIKADVDNMEKAPE